MIMIPHLFHVHEPTNPGHIFSPLWHTSDACMHNHAVIVCHREYTSLLSVAIREAPLRILQFHAGYFQSLPQTLWNGTLSYIS
jgi:hypothetical protein